MEKSHYVSAFDMLRERVMWPDLWISAEQPAASRREITRQEINRIFKGMLEDIGLSSLRTQSSLHLGQGVEIKR
jgi:hypothetical protein